MTFVDALIVALVIAAAWSGFRRGFVSSFVSLVGALGGLIVAIWLAPYAMERVDQQAAKFAIGIACVVVGVGLGELAGSFVGRTISDQVTWKPARAVDRGLGLVGQGLLVLIGAWLIAAPLASVPYATFASAVRSSTIIGAVDKVMPAGAQEVSDRMRELFDSSGFPAILDPLTPTPDTPVAAPDSAILNDPEVVAAGGSVLKVRSQAPSCSRSIEGSGFVFAPGRLMTNAHVVAGASTVTVEVGRDQMPATVVVYDPARDLAVLTVSGLSVAPLTFASGTAAGESEAMAAGYPLDGPYTATPARIRSQITLRGPDIYDSSTVNRDVYTIRASIRPGNSGGPLIDTNGQVIGVIFGASIDKPDVGFALTAAEAAPVVAEGLTDQTAADTGSCVLD